MEKAKYEYALSNRGSDEISLVDLARIIIKWRKLECSILIFFFLAGLVYVLLVPRSYEFSSVYQMAADGDKPLEAPTGLISKIKNFFEPGVYQQLSKQGNESSVGSIKINISNPDSTYLIVLHSLAPKSRKSAVRSLHEQLLKRIEGEQKKLYQRKKNALNAQLKSLSGQLNELRQATGDGQAASIASTLSQRNNVQEHLADLSQGQSLVLAQPSLKPKGHGYMIVMLLSLLFGGGGALLAGFVAEFVALVSGSYDH